MVTKYGVGERLGAPVCRFVFHTGRIRAPVSPWFIRV